jgi:hypothetical protein
VHHDDVAAQQLDRILISGADFAKSVLGRKFADKTFLVNIGFVNSYSKICR